MEAGLGAVGEVAGAHKLCLPLCIRAPGWTCETHSRVGGQPASTFQSIKRKITAIHSETGYPGSCLLLYQKSGHTSVTSELILMKPDALRQLALWVLSDGWIEFWWNNVCQLPWPQYLNTSTWPYVEARLHVVFPTSLTVSLCSKQQLLKWKLCRINLVKLTDVCKYSRLEFFLFFF